MRQNRKGNGGDRFGVSVRGMKESGKEWEEIRPNRELVNDGLEGEWAGP